MKIIRKNLSRTLNNIYEIPGAGERFKAMEGVRAYAALLIFSVHYFDAYLREFLKIDPDSLSFTSIKDPEVGAAYYLWASHYGVDIFFFLSGFLIFKMVVKRHFSFPRFVLFRFLRIYPAALSAICFWAWMRIDAQGWYDFNLMQFFQNLFFLNAIPSLGVKPYNIVTWSLFYEMVFYLTFPVVFLFLKKIIKYIPLAILIAAMLYLYAAQPLGANAVRFLMFFGGALLAMLSKDQIHIFVKRTPDWLVTLVYLASTLIFTIHLSYNIFIPVFVFTSFFFIANIIYGSGFLNRIFSFTPLRWLGNISYSFYLMHLLGIQLVMFNFFSTFENLNKPALIGITFSLSLLISGVISTILYVLAERPYWRRKGVTALASAP